MTSLTVRQNRIELAVPPVLPLAGVKLANDDEEKSALLGVALQHPPVDLLARQHTTLDITGGRADVAHAYALRFIKSLNLQHSGQVEIELAVPAYMGLSSEPVLGMAVARALAWVHDLGDQQDPGRLAQAVGLSAREVLAFWSFSKGGLLLTDTRAPDGQMPPLILRTEIEHPEKNAWAFVFLFPRVGAEVPETIEADKLKAVIAASHRLDASSGELVTDRLWPAVERDDLVDFGLALAELLDANRTALAEAGYRHEDSDADTEILELMRRQGAVFAGRTLTGFGLFGLVRGGNASRELRKALRDHVGYTGGIVMATITDNRGAHSLVRDWRGNIVSPGE